MSVVEPVAGSLIHRDFGPPLLLYATEALTELDDPRVCDQLARPQLEGKQGLPEAGANL
jgi:hypothetical protein